MNVNPMTPLTELIVCSNVPLDNTYSDTLTFGSLAAQEAFFKTKARFTFGNLGPVRLENAIRVPKNADELFNCNYLMFRNANFGNKWFYAFITKIEYINVNMSVVNFDIDVMQTWKFDYTVKECFVEREHANSDAIGSNLIPENLELGEYVMREFVGTGLLSSDWRIVVAATTDEGGGDVFGAMYSGIYSGLHYNVFDNAYSVSSYLDALTTMGKADAIVSIFMMPRNMIDTGGSDKPKELTFIVPKNYEAIDEYKPRNNKLFTYPYNFLYATNNDGSEATFMYERFGGGSNITFKLKGDMSSNPQVIVYPQNYKGVAENYNEKMVISGFPQCAWTSDAFKAWLAQTASSNSIGIMASAFTAVGGLATGNLGVAFAGGVGVASTLAKIQDHSRMPPQAHGQNGSSINFAAGLKDFYVAHMYITVEFARQIDDFFDMFGYATHRLKVPNMTGRPSWNYVKCIESKIVGNVPFGDLAVIKANFDRGITFWHGDYVGDYSRNNKV